jgi:hypothetical protein
MTKEGHSIDNSVTGLAQRQPVLQQALDLDIGTAQ